MRMEGKIYVASHQIDGTMVYGNGAGCGALILAQADAQTDVVDVVNTITNLLTNAVYFFFFSSSVFLFLFLFLF